jgi:hypothetical protein
MLYLNNYQVYKVNFEYYVLILFRKLHYIGDSHYLVLFSIRIIPGTTLIETILTGGPPVLTKDMKAASISKLSQDAINCVYHYYDKHNTAVFLSAH